LDHLKQSENAKIVLAGSNIIKHFFNPNKKINFEHLRRKNPAGHSHSVYQMYCQSKMALLLLTFKMAEEYKRHGINVNALQINGAKMSKETIKKFKIWWRPVAWVQNLFFRSPEFMANHYLNCASPNLLIM